MIVHTSFAHHRIAANREGGPASPRRQSIRACGMGEVYRARDSKVNRDVAIEVLPAAFALDAERLTRFTREAQILESLDHPNITPHSHARSAGTAVPPGASIR